MIEVLKTRDGGAVSDYRSAFRFAASLLEKAGFEQVGASGLSASMYFARPGRTDKIRVADHVMKHERGTVAEVRLANRRETIIREIEFDGEDGGIETMEEEEFNVLVIADDARLIETKVAQAIREYEAAG